MLDICIVGSIKKKYNQKIGDLEKGNKKNTNSKFNPIKWNVQN